MRVARRRAVSREVLEAGHDASPAQAAQVGSGETDHALGIGAERAGVDDGVVRPAGEINDRRQHPRDSQGQRLPRRHKPLQIRQLLRSRGADAHVGGKRRAVRAMRPRSLLVVGAKEKRMLRGARQRGYRADDATGRRPVEAEATRAGTRPEGGALGIVLAGREAGEYDAADH